MQFSCSFKQLFSQFGLQIDPKTFRQKGANKKRVFDFFNILDVFSSQNLTLVMVKPGLVVKRFGA